MACENVALLGNNNWASTQEACLRGSDQPAHPRRLISAYVIRILERIISKLDTGEI